MELITFKLNIKTLARLAPLNRRWQQWTLYSNFWYHYLMDRLDPQDCFHRSLIELSQLPQTEGIFLRLWHDRSIPLIRESRSLFESYEQAYFAGNEHLAFEIYKLSPHQIMTQLLGAEFELNYFLLDSNLRMRRYAKHNDRIAIEQMLAEIFIEYLYHGLLSEFEMKSYLKSLFKRLYVDSNDYEFIIYFDKKYGAGRISVGVDNIENLAEELLSEGRYELVIKLIEHGYLAPDSEIDWSFLVRSDRPDLLELLQHHQLFDDYSGLGWRFIRQEDVFEWYLNHNHHSNHLQDEIILNQYRWRTPNDYVKLIHNHFKRGWPKQMKSYLRRWQEQGYDYLYSLFKNESFDQ